jgi:hypothetical protein
VVKTAGHTYLYDFYEAGIADAATVGQALPDKLGAERNVRAALLASDQVIGLIVTKLNELALHSPPAAKRLLEVIAGLQWQVVPPALVSTHDLGRSPIRVEGDLQVYQLAVRDDTQRTVWINLDLWNELNDVHKAGLVFHEALYHIASVADDQRDSYPSRLLNAYFFDPRFALKSDDEIATKLASVFPAALAITKARYEWQTGDGFRRDCAAYRKDVMGKAKNAGVMLARMMDRVNRAVADFGSAYGDQGAANADYSTNGIRKDYRFTTLGGARVALPVYDGREDAYNGTVYLERQLKLSVYSSPLFGIGTGTSQGKNYTLVTDGEFSVLLAGTSAAERAEAGDEAKFGGRCLTAADRNVIRALKLLDLTH